MNVYQENGYASRRDHLNCLAEDFGVPISVVQELAATLGPDEDFDGLVTEVEDISDDNN